MRTCHVEYYYPLSSFRTELEGSDTQVLHSNQLTSRARFGLAAALPIVVHLVARDAHLCDCFTRKGERTVGRTIEFAEIIALLQGAECWQRARKCVWRVRCKPPFN